METTSQALICGVPIHVATTCSTHAIQPPLIYEWRIYEGDTLTCVYIGKAKNGVSRPLNTYPAVVRDLHQNRGVCNLLRIPVTPYFKRNPWGFRWIHHQLESCVARILAGNPKKERIELHFPLVTIPLSKLNDEEKRLIKEAKEKYDGTHILANGQPSMRVQYFREQHRLDPVWI